MKQEEKMKNLVNLSLISINIVRTLCYKNRSLNPICFYTIPSLQSNHFCHSHAEKLHIPFFIIFSLSLFRYTSLDAFVCIINVNLNFIVIDKNATFTFD